MKVVLIMIKKNNRHWAQDEFGMAGFNDGRLSKRLIDLADDFLTKPYAQIPEATTDWAGAKGAYRFFDNKKVTVEKIIQPHYQSTLERLKNHKIILSIQDTSFLWYKNHEVEGLGHLTGDLTKKSGLIIHPTLAITPEGVPIGFMHLKVWARSEVLYRPAVEVPIDQKESFKWIQSYRATCGFEKQLDDVHFVNICDREADIYELFLETQKDDHSSDLLVRLEKNRKIEGEYENIKTYLSTLNPSGELTVQVPKRGKEKGREAKLTIRFGVIKIKPPVPLRKIYAQFIKLWIIEAKEENAPENVKEPIHWKLLTTMEVNSFQRAIEKIKWYTCRWVIERLFKVLKSGCNVEKRKLANAERLKKSVALDLIVSYRILFLTMVDRDFPDMPVSALFEDYEWKALYCYRNRSMNVPGKPPMLSEFRIKIAQLGGFLARKSDGNPGSITLRRGLEKLHFLAMMYKILTQTPITQLSI